ncbi:polysaccharide lyase family 7 protein [Nocardia sp. NBC_00511]|uniref:polysaccharide lyase family 7 protein n=1 Tax=Nocardia sp. NBC_00511 TaxID=2903591 RepID=UPI0030E5A415
MKLAATLMTIAVTAVSMSACAGPAATGSAQPGTQVSLAGWKLTLPVDSGGQLSGNAAVVDQAEVRAPWLTRNTGGGLEFWAPATGARTPHSQHSRTELVNSTNFALGGARHTLSATVEVTQLPSAAPNIIIGQIHEPGPVPFLLLHYEGGRIFASWRTSLDGSTKAGEQQLVSGVPLNSAFTYTITAEAGNTLGLSVTYNGATTSETVTVPAPFVGTQERFQAGDYQQATTSSGPGDGGRVVFDALSAD